MIVPIIAPISELLNREFLENSLRAWLTAGITTVVMFVILYVVRNVTASRLGALAAKTTNYIDDMVVDIIAATRKWVMLAMSILVGFGALELPHVGQFFAPAAKLVLLWQIAIWGAAAINFWVKHHLDKRTNVAERGGVAMINAMGIAAKAVLWILIVITALHSVFGINPTPWITGLGVSGIAVALAVQNILGDLLAALAIVFDKPFDVGDSIGVDQINGTV